MSVVTVTGHLGSFASDIAARAARELDYAMADRELLIEGASALGWTEQQVEEFDVRTQGMGSRLVGRLRAFLEGSGAAEGDPELVQRAGGLEAIVGQTYGETGGAEMRHEDTLYIEALRALVRSFADRGSMVLVGRGSQAMLADRDETLHVRVVCPAEERVRRVAERYEMTEDAARERVERSDRNREQWHRKYFDIDYRSPYHYHLVVNSGRLSDDVAAHLVVQAVQDREPRPG